MLTAHLGALEFLPDDRQAVLDPGLDRQGGPGRLPVPDLARRPACEPARPDLDLARDCGQRHADARPGRRPAHLGDPGRASHPAPGAVAPARPRRNRASSAAASCSASRSPRPCATCTGATARRPSPGLCGTSASCWRRRTGTPRNGPPTASGEARSRRSPRGIPTAPTPSATASRLTPRRELRALALPSEIMRLENLHGYLKFPGPFPVASIRLKYVARGPPPPSGSCRARRMRRRCHPSLGYRVGRCPSRSPGSRRGRGGGRPPAGYAFLAG